MDLVYKIVRRLFRDDDVSFSRNRNFDAYEDPKVRRAVRIYRHLSSVEDDLLAAEQGGITLGTVRRDGGRVVLELLFEDDGGHRISYLSRGEWSLLLESERVADIVRELVDDASQEVRDLVRVETSEP
jgi:hypothetical protein